MEQVMSKNDADEIRRIVDAGGWQAVREHPVYGPIWATVLKEQKRFEEGLQDG